MRRHLCVTVVLFLAASSTATAAIKLATTQLPRNVSPTHYDVSLEPNAEQLTFVGNVAITLNVIEPTPIITLNQANLTIQSASLSSNDPRSLQKYPSPKIELDTSKQTASFTFDRPLVKGSYRLTIDYRGKINSQANGLFAINYATKSGAKRALYTQFEHSDARRVIPSWDEPSYKATFTLQATVPSTQMAVSNMPVEQRADGPDGRSVLRFARSPKMSTYLLFFGLGDFDRATAKLGNTEIGVVTQKGSVSQAAFVLESSQAIVREYNDYFGAPYPLPKLDNIASPGRSQFFSAMENWGAIYTFEHAILLDPTISTQRDKQGAFSIAAHEIAHQWFGNLVTMSWWDDLWLNEGFATWMSGRTTALLHPEWNTSLGIVERREAAITRDSLATTHPVVQHVATVEQASQSFDAITYQKGAAVIRMLEGYVGEDAWRSGVRQYIKKHAYANTESDDLWREIEIAAKKPIVAIAHDFTLLPGVPMIFVGEPRCVNNTTSVVLTQGEFSRDQPNKKPLQWRVPVIVQGGKGSASARTLVTNGKATVKLQGCNTPVVNAGQSGYYRTLYSPQHFSRIKNEFASIATVDQLGILSDTWSLGLNGQQPIDDVLELATAIPVNAHPQVWGNVSDIFGSINSYYASDEVRRKRFRTFAIARLSPVLASVGWNAKSGESSDVAILRNELIGTLSGLGDPAVIAEARRQYAVDDTVSVPAAIRKTLLGVIARHADQATWERLHAVAQRETTPLIKDQYYSLLASVEDQGLARRALELSITTEPGATNSSAMIARVAALHPDLAFDFAMAHMKQVNENVDGNARNQYFAGLASASVDEAMIEKVRSYADAHLPAGSRRSADTVIARIKNGIQVRTERLPAIDQWLANKNI